MAREPGEPARGARWGVYSAALRAFRALPIPVRRLVVRAMTPSYVVGAVCAVTAGDSLLVLRQPHRPGWSLPGGLVERGETPAACVARELREETGLEVEVGLPVATVVAPRARRVDVVFRVEVAAEFAVPAGSEAERTGWQPLAGLTDTDEPTRDILAALRRAEQPDAYRGRLLG